MYQIEIMDNLPREIIQKIVSYLIDDTNDARIIVKLLFNLLATCKKYSDLDLQPIFRSVAIELHPKLQYSNDKKLDWRKIVNAVISSYTHNYNANQESVDLAREMVEHGSLFPYYEPPKYMTSSLLLLPEDQQRVQIREFLKKMPNVNMLYPQYQQLYGTMLYHLCSNVLSYNTNTYQTILLEELLAAGADPNLPGVEGNYRPIYELIHYRISWPICKVTYFGWTDGIDRLLLHDGVALDVFCDADVTAHQCHGELSPIHAACLFVDTLEYSFSYDVLKSLLQRVGSCSKFANGIAPHFCPDYHTNQLAFKSDQNNVTALHLACLRLYRSNGRKVVRPDLASLKLLFEYGANINAQTTPDKFTPLHILFAAVHKELEQNIKNEKERKVGFDLRSVVKFLVQDQNANLSLMNSRGQSVLDYAMIVQNQLDPEQSIAEFLPK